MEYLTDALSIEKHIIKRGFVVYSVSEIDQLILLAVGVLVRLECAQQIVDILQFYVLRFLILFGFGDIR